MAIASTVPSARLHWSRGLLGLAMIACVALATAASAADPPGKAVFEQYCASCHGMAADGKGPVAAELKVAPADLRKLGKEFGTPLAKPKLLEVIDGRNMVRAHGTATMPVWGDQLVREVPPSTNTEFFKRATILVIIEYLQTLQVE